MSDSDPISEGTPNKRRKLNAGSSSKAWNSEDDSGDELTADDFHHTVATVPVGSQQGQQKRQLQYTPEQFHTDIRPSNQHTYITQPTQTLRLDSQQPTESLPHTSDVLVNRSSPAPESSSPTSKAPPQPVRRAFGRPNGGLLATTIAPHGTAFRPPMGIPQQKQKPETIDIDSEDDPPINHSSDEEGETQGLRSNLKPTNFKKGGRGLDSTPNVVKESPKPAQFDTFKNLMSEFSYSSPSRPVDDLASAYGNARRSKPAPPAGKQLGPTKALPVQNGVIYNTLDDIEDYEIRNKVRRIQADFGWETVQRCMDALIRKKGNVDDAKEWLTADEEQDAPIANEDLDELASNSPVAKRGVAMASSSQLPRRATAKQEVKAPLRTIAQKYQPTQAARRTSLHQQEDLEEEDIVKPKRRLQQGRRSARPSPSSSPQPPARPIQREVLDSEDAPEGDIVIDSEQNTQVDQVRLEAVESRHERRLLAFFNDCTIEALAETSAQPEDVARQVLEHRPFDSLEVIRTISTNGATKSGKKSRARNVGDKIVDLCSEMLTGYDAVDELVDECERIAKPIREDLKSWGVATAGEDGELQLTNFDHDSGIGTPASSSDDHTMPRAPGGFLKQPTNMSPDFTLKDYQLVGLNWLNLLWSKKLSCILADEMGLGKTCQVIAFLAHLQQEGVDGVHLVIVPGSTLENWLREFQRFAPSLNVLPYYGKQEERAELQVRIEEEFDSIDVIVTTIDMAVKPEDNKFLRKHVDPLVCVLDEAHALRNAQTDRYKQLRKIPASFRVLLTGTPLQNNLQELMALLAFMMPDLFRGSEEELRYIFQHKATTKDVNNAALLSAQRIARARSMMTPFILRRKKVQVLELPAKTNHTEYCEMQSTQSKYYSSLVQEFQEYYANPSNRKAKVANTSNMLMAVRKAAIHPLLARRLYDDAKIDKIVKELMKHTEFCDNKPDRVRDYLIGEHAQSFKGGDYGLHLFCRQRPHLRKFELRKRDWMESSGKVTRFQELVKNIAANADRALVFSQFTTMMDILEGVLDGMNIKFMRLDGSTNMQIRQDMIDQFTNDTSITVFMLSTRAGGAGINLAAANKVIIFDSGFNPQDDIQAENRAHRVGQTRPVDVYRLVTRGTIEEQIQALHESKLELGERVAEDVSAAAEDKQAEKDGEKMVQKMFLDNLKKESDEGEVSVKDEQTDEGIDLRHAFKNGLESAGLRVASKQAQF